MLGALRQDWFLLLFLFFCDRVRLTMAVLEFTIVNQAAFRDTPASAFHIRIKGVYLAD